MIIPSSAVGLDETGCLRGVLRSRYGDLSFSTYSIRPAKLFEGVDQRLCIVLGGNSRGRAHRLFTTTYNHWQSEARPFLFANLRYVPSLVHGRLDRVAQLGDSLEVGLLARLETQSDHELQSYYSSGSGFLAHYHRSPRYWIRAMDFAQYFKSDTRARSVHHFRDLVFGTETDGKCACAAINSSLFFFWFMSICNGRNLTSVDVGRFPIGAVHRRLQRELVVLYDRLMEDYRKNSFVRKRTDCEYQEFRPALSKRIIDKIDTVLAKHYGFTDEELDFIINYDIKYRAGFEDGSNEE